MTNAYRHSEGNHAEVHIGVIAVGGGLVIEVSDNGVGLNDQSPEGVGLRSMQARVAQVGGHLEISPRPSGGTIVRAEFPLTPGVPK